MKLARLSLPTLILILVPAFGLTPRLSAATIDWSATAVGTGWATGANWVGGTAPANDLTTDIARFNQSSYAFQPAAPNLQSIGGLIFGNNSTATANINMVTGINTNRLNIGSSGIVMNTQSGAAFLGSGSTTQGVQLGASQSWTNNSGSLLTVSSVSGQTAGQNYVLTIDGSGTGGTLISGIIRNEHTSNNATVSLVINTSGGVTTLAVGNTFSGDTTLTSGVLALNNSGALTNSALNTTGTGTVTTTATTLVFGGLKGSRNLSSVITSGFGSVTALTLNPLSGTSTYSGVISNGAATTSLTKSGAGTQVLEGANTYTGATTVTGGVLGVTSLGNASVASTLGQSSSAATNLVLNGGTLQLMGSSITTQSTDRLFNLGAGGGTLDSSAGAGSSMNFTNVGTIGANNVVGNRTLTLTGSRNGSIASIIGQRNNTDSLTSVLKTGNGTWTLSGANTYNGTTTVSGGTLLVNGSLAAGSAVSVTSGGRLGGNGTINGSLTVAGVHAPGNSPGLQTVGGNLTYTTGASVEWELEANAIGTRGVQYDAINVGGNLDFSALTTLTLDFATGVSWSDGFWASDRTGTAGWLIFDVAGTTTGLPSNLTLNNAANWLDSGSNSLASIRSGASFSLYQDGNDVYLNYSAIPEPGTYAMLLGGLGLLILLRRKKF